MDKGKINKEHYKQIGEQIKSNEIKAKFTLLTPKEVENDRPKSAKYLEINTNPMKILHITPKSNGYEEVILIANKINRKNSLSAIEVNGELHYTGGFLINDTPEIRKVLDSIPRELQYNFVQSFKMDPFVKFYLEED